MNAEEYLKVALGGNMNIRTLKPAAWHDIMTDFAKHYHKELSKSVLPDVSVCAEKPPLGLKPRKFVDEDRLREVQGAMVRYYDANKPMPLEWITEYNELVERLH